jgi:hypothetical protein
MSENFISKENTTNLYKQITMMNELTNLSKQQKDFIVTQLIDTMKRTYKTLDLKKINEGNIENVKKQYNSIVTKQTSELIKKSVSNNNNNNNISHRNNERTFESIKRNIPQPTGIDRPSSSVHGNPVLPTQMKVSDDYLKKTTGDLASRLSELENSRRVNNNERPVDVPDWLKPEKVGRANDFNMPSPSMPERKLEGIGGFDNDNFKKDVPMIDTSKYNDNMSIQDRLKKLESDRGMPVNTNGNSAGGNVNQSNLSDMFSNTIPSNQQAPRAEQPSSAHYQPTYRAEPPPQAPRAEIPQQLLQQLNEMQQFIQSLRQDNDQLKSQIKSSETRGPNTKSLQIDINKKEAIYNFQFNPLNNVVSLKLLSYNLPQPVYNIIENTNFIYKMNDIDHSIIIPKGNYSIENLINYLNKNNDLIFSIDFTQKVSIKSKEENIIFEIVPNLMSYKLGFINSKNNVINNTCIIADRIYDLRMPSKLLLFIKNINPDGPICILNFNNTSICNLQFNNPMILSSLELEFYTEDNVLYNFNDIMYNLSFAIDILS